MLRDEDFLQKFRDCTLPAEEFGHLGHIRVGWLYLTALPTEAAIAQLSDDIKRYATHLGAQQKFHRTITEALMRLMASHLGREGGLTWQQFVAHNPVIVEDARGLLLRLYSEDRLSSAQARTSYLSPDRQPMPTG